MWRFKTGSNLDELAAAIHSLKGKVDSLMDLEVGINFNPSDSAYDLVFTGTFENKLRLGEFEQDPYHKEISTRVSAAKESRVVVDYEVR